MAKQYVSRRYLREKWDKLRIDMEGFICVYDEDGPDNVAERASRVADEIRLFAECIVKEIGA